MIWFDGSVRHSPTLTLEAGDRGLTLGDGIFETIAVFGRVPFRLGDHLARLEDAAQVLGFPLPRATVEQAIADLVAAMTDDHAALRITVTRGPGPRGLAPPAEPRPTVFATLAPWSPSMAFQPIRLVTSTIRRNETSPLSRIKSLAYLDNVLAFQQAKAAGAGDALILNTAGNVASTAMANLFVIQGEELVTPPVSDGVRPGVMRQLLLGVVSGFRPAERAVEPAGLGEANAVFATNSLRLLCPVTALDGRALPQNDEIVRRLSAILRDAVKAECAADPFEPE
ncbi:class IV aminotransferase [Oleomonas cavernae]|uniref:Probable branched-chain-amino-acid aminotransferase n=1 Tax=Oleomonas cavernae TaxID=2320859 RepID=A0A418WGG8_9PROT|nr:aminotransferase class IV [Oleomonas cavernae]RJF89133.1 class IV aminotransferase [Oleomonas cavernae]